VTVIKMPDVTVIIPTRDRWHLLPAAVGCALRQAGVSLEVVVVDDGSLEPPPDLKVLRDRRVRLVRHAVRTGLSAARNTGMGVAAGPWLAWLDDDDLWAPDKLARQLAMAADATMIYAGAIVIDRSLRMIDAWPSPSADGLATRLVKSNVIPAGSSNVLARTAAVRALGGFDESLTHLQDWDMWLRLARVGPAARCADTLVAYMIHGDNMHLGAHDFMGEFDRLAAKHAAWSSNMGLTFDRAGFARYPGEILVSLGQRSAACSHLVKHGLSPPTLGNVRGVAGVLAGPNVRRVYRRARRRPVLSSEAPAWLDTLRRDADRLSSRDADSTLGSGASLTDAPTVRADDEAAREAT
jgi:glycosyltransferase involved in cell wall biosynthesis